MINGLKEEKRCNWLVVPLSSGDTAQRLPQRATCKKQKAVRSQVKASLITNPSELWVSERLQSFASVMLLLARSYGRRSSSVSACCFSSAETFTSNRKAFAMPMDFSYPFKFFSWHFSGLSALLISTWTEDWQLGLFRCLLVSV